MFGRFAAEGCLKNGPNVFRKSHKYGINQIGKSGQIRRVDLAAGDAVAGAHFTIHIATGRSRVLPSVVTLPKGDDRQQSPQVGTAGDIEASVSAPRKEGPIHRLDNIFRAESRPILAGHVTSRERKQAGRVVSDKFHCRSFVSSAKTVV
jgi:hypothetical protein